MSPWQAVNHTSTTEADPHTASETPRYITRTGQRLLQQGGFADFGVTTLMLFRPCAPSSKLSLPSYLISGTPVKRESCNLLRCTGR